ncbi:MAG: hypothetical protein MJZ38_05270 [archaeon]|nr:hypothetical protein [archaeon]
MAPDSDLSRLNYARLNDTERVIYDHVAAGLERLEEKVTIPAREIRGDFDFSRVLDAIVSECDNAHVLKRSGMRYSFGLTALTVFCDTSFGTDSARMAVRALEREVSRIASACLSECSTDLEKEQFIHDYLADTVTYTHETCVEDGSEYTAYGALVEHKAVCMGIAIAARMLLNRVGVDCGCVSNKEHMWNVVRVDGIVCNLDVTWDLKDEVRSYIYFNMSDRMIQKDHPLVFGPSCDSDSMYWYRINDLDLRFEEQVTDAVYAAVRAGSRRVTFRIPRVSTEDVIGAVQKGFARGGVRTSFTYSVNEVHSVYSISWGTPSASAGSSLLSSLRRHF